MYMYMYTVPEGIGPGMPAELPPNGVGNGCDKLSPQAKVSTQMSGELLGAVEGVRQVPLKLVHQRDVANVDVQLGSGDTQTYMYTSIVARTAGKGTDISIISVRHTAVQYTTEKGYANFVTFTARFASFF